MAMAGDGTRSPTPLRPAALTSGRAKDTPTMPRLTIIIGSTRPGRAGLPIAAWFAGRARSHAGFDVDVVDLAELNLPLLDEPNHPRLGQYIHQHTKHWSAIVDAGDAFVIVTPEYNHGYPAALKNAIDYLHNEWSDKPVGFVSYGGVSAGTRAVEQLKQVVTTLKMLAVVEAVSIPFHPQFIGEDGCVQANDIMDQAAGAMLDELVRVERAVRPLREPIAQAA
jgi:NAD(P)H-dependent FMN reductase